MGKVWELVAIAPILDPRREEVTEAVKVVHQAGISVKMIAGVGVKCGS